MRVDDWGFWVLVGVAGFSWVVVGGEWCGGCGVASLKNFFEWNFL